MTVVVGTHLGPYEITGKLGEGGMGEVYRAIDSRLKREVAIKVLPAAFTTDRDHLARFEREAQLLAQLHHPNIASIFGLEDVDLGRALVMELVGGVDLSALIARGPVPIDEALAIAKQIADALEVAHEQGIVHRDLKPQNVKVRADGTVKVLDFGLAKAMNGAQEGITDLRHSPTLTHAAGTQLGVILGTAAYMSPEQARGRALDKRSDLWSFGALLYEMLSGQRLFTGETVSDTMAAVLRQEVDWRRLPADTPAEVRRLLARLLERDPRHRLHDMADARIMLQEAIAGGDVGREGEPVAPAVGTSWAPRALALAAVLALSAAALYIGPRWRGPAAAAATAAPKLVSFSQLTDMQGVESAPTMAPDGKSVVYVARAGDHLGLYLERVGGRNATLLTPGSTSDDWQPAFSPDGEQLAFRSERDGGGIFLMGSTGESVKRLTDFGFNPSWSPDGKEIVVGNGTAMFPTDRGAVSAGLLAVEVATGRHRTVTTASDCLQPAWSPHGQRIAFWGVRGDSGQRDLFTVAAGGADAAGKEVTNDSALDWNPVWSPDGRWLWFSSNRGGSMNLWRVRIDEATGRVLGEPEAMTVPSLWSGDITFSRDGHRIAFTSLLWRSRLLRAPFDPQTERVTGAAVPILESTQPIRDHQISHDGQWVAFSQTTNQEDLAVARLDGSEYRRLTDDRFRDRGPSWSPDDKEIAFYSDRGGTYQVWEIRPDGSGLHQLATSPGSANFPLFSPDGARLALSIIFGSKVGSTPSWGLVDLRPSTAPLATRVLPMPELTEGTYWPTSWSADGKRLVGVIVRRTGTPAAIATYELADGHLETVLQADNPSWLVATWLHDSRRLLVRDRRGILLLDCATRRAQRLIDVGGYFVGLSVGLMPGDRGITYTETATEGDVWVAELR